MAIKIKNRDPKTNDFSNQEPGSVYEVRQFCDHNYGVSFDIFDKIKIRGSDSHQLYSYLETLFFPVKRPVGVKAKIFQGFTALKFWLKVGRVPRVGEVQWNFHKFIISRKGFLAGHFSSDCDPFDPQIIACIEHELAKNKLNQNDH